MVHRIVSRVGSDAALDFWADRLEGEGVEVTRGDGGSVVFSDFEGLTHELVVNTSGDEPLTAEHPEIPAEHALQGFEGVRAYSDDTAATRIVLEQVLGAPRRRRATPGSCAASAAAATIAYDPAPLERGRQSAGTVHHVAWGTTVDEHPRWQEHLTRSASPPRGSSTATTSTRSTSASPAASCSRSPTTGPASRSTCRSRSSGRRSSCRRSSSLTARRSSSG